MTDIRIIANALRKSHPNTIKYIEEKAKREELEACIEIVKTLRPWLSKYHSSVSSEPTRKDIIEALEARKYLPQQTPPPAPDL